jgi:hypothetical protein
MFWIALTAQLTAIASDNAARPVASTTNIEVTVERLPPGLKSPTFVRVKFVVGTDGRTSSCAAAEATGLERVENDPTLLRIACGQIVNGFRATPAKDASGKRVPSLRTALFRFSTDQPISMQAAPARERPPYRGGLLDGIYVGEVMRPDNGVRFFGLKPSKPNASPVPARDAPAVGAFMDAFEHKDLSRLNGYVTKDVQQEHCGHGFYSACGPKRPLSELKVAEDCTFNTPYYLGDHTVRLEWLYRGTLWYWSEVYLSDGRIRLVRTHPADMPPDHP